MPQAVAHVVLLVPDYDEALAYYRDVLGFAVLADDDLGGGRRWMLVAPSVGGGASLLLAACARDWRRRASGAICVGRRGAMPPHGFDVRLRC